MIRKKRFWLLVSLVVLVGAIGGYYYYSNTVIAAAQDDAAAELQTTLARRGEITVSATGAGTIIAAQEVELSFANSGILAELLVRVGDNVKAGEVLARLDDTAVQEALADAQSQLAQAAMQTDASATETGISYDDISVEQAELALAEAQAALDDLINWEPDPDEIAQAEANLKAAQASLNAAYGSEAASNTNVTINQIELEAAQRDLAYTQENYDKAWTVDRDWETFWNEPICDPGEIEPCTGQTWKQRIENERVSTSNALIRAQENLQIAQANYDSSVSSRSYSGSASAQSSVLSAELALEAAQTRPIDDEIMAAETAVRQAELSLQQALLNRESNQLSLEQAQRGVTAAEEAVEDTTLTAPITGTVMAVNYSVGETVSGAVIVLADLEQPLLEIYLDESDLNMVGVGYEAEVVFDALPDDTFTGRVIQVDPQLVDSNGVTAVRAVLQLNTDSFAKPQTLPVGLNATVEVIGGRAQNAVLVPVEALRELSEGQYAVFVMEDGEPKLRSVEVGLMDFTFAEIISGVSEGETVTTGIVETQ